MHLVHLDVVEGISTTAALGGYTGVFPAAAQLSILDVQTHKVFADKKTMQCLQFKTIKSVLLYSSTYSSIPLSPPDDKMSLLGNTPVQKTDMMPRIII